MADDQYRVARSAERADDGKRSPLFGIGDDHAAAAHSLRSMINHRTFDHLRSPALLKSLLERIAPRSLVSTVRDYRDIAADQRSTFVRLRTRRMLGLRDDRAKVTKASRHFLFICFGNIMRSPMAAA